MADWRKLRSAMWRDKKVCRLSRDARLLFVALITISDDEGYFAADPEELKIDLFPLDTDLTPDGIEELLDELAAVDNSDPVLKMGHLGTKPVGFLTKFEKNQGVRGDRRKPSNFKRDNDGNQWLPTDNQGRRRLDKTILDKTRLELVGKNTASPASPTDKAPDQKPKTRTWNQAANDQLFDAVKKTWSQNRARPLRASEIQSIANRSKTWSISPVALTYYMAANVRGAIPWLNFTQGQDRPADLENAPDIETWRREDDLERAKKPGPASIRSALSLVQVPAPPAEGTSAHDRQS